MNSGSQAMSMQDILKQAFKSKFAALHGDDATSPYDNDAKKPSQPPGTLANNPSMANAKAQMALLFKPKSAVVSQEKVIAAQELPKAGVASNPNILEAKNSLALLFKPRTAPPVEALSSRAASLNENLNLAEPKAAAIPSAPPLCLKATNVYIDEAQDQNIAAAPASSFNHQAKVLIQKPIVKTIEAKSVNINQLLEEYSCASHQSNYYRQNRHAFIMATHTISDFFAVIDALESKDRASYLLDIKSTPKFKTWPQNDHQLEHFMALMTRGYIDTFFICEYAKHLNLKALLSQVKQGNKEVYERISNLEEYLPARKKVDLVQGVLNIIDTQNDNQQIDASAPKTSGVIAAMILELLGHGTSRDEMLNHIKQSKTAQRWMLTQPHFFTARGQKEIIPLLSAELIALEIKTNRLNAKAYLTYCSEKQMRGILAELDTTTLVYLGNTFGATNLNSTKYNILQTALVQNCLENFDRVVQTELEKIQTDIDKNLGQKRYHHDLMPKFLQIKSSLIEARQSLHQDGNIKKFEQTCMASIQKGQKEFEKHRGWHRVSLVFRSLIGVLSILTIIPAAVIYANKLDLKSTFFTTPKASTHNALSHLDELINFKA